MRLSSIDVSECLQLRWHIWQIEVTYPIVRSYGALELLESLVARASCL